MEIVALFPGQGSQKPGMARDLVEASPAARAAFETVDAALQQPLARLCFEGPADELSLTHNAQPALLAHGAAVWAALGERVQARVRAAAGHSLGEFTAYHAAGALTLPSAARLVRRRGELMYETGRSRPGSMAAVLGTVRCSIDDLCRKARDETGATVVPANYNSPEQVVVSGDPSAVERVSELATEAGAKRAIPLNVSGAFHSPLMEPARDGLRRALEEAGFGTVRFPVVSNVTEAPVTDGAVACDLLVQQLTAPVRWIGVVRTLAAAHPSAVFVEMGPGAVLTGLVKRIAPEVRTATCGTAAEVERLAAELS